ncbi:hypothetical protein LX36DRAFT_21307 [Colletotrichum falcatum]|nr:hypothetical protein LX36DRAFT_21307 [Colletotrichum falcatum]
MSHEVSSDPTYYLDTTASESRSESRCGTPFAAFFSVFFFVVANHSSLGMSAQGRKRQAILHAINLSTASTPFDLASFVSWSVPRQRLWRGPPVRASTDETSISCCSTDI